LGEMLQAKVWSDSFLETAW